MLKKIKKFFAVFIIIIFFAFIFSLGKIYTSEEISYGVTFSKKEAESLELDWRDLYVKIFDELCVKKIRLAAYWDEVEPAASEFSWDNLDWQINEAGKRNAKIILAVGGRLPRWPECHLPPWAENLAQNEREKSILNYIENTVNRYKDNNSVTAWQIENEPFLSHFGDCPRLDKKFLDKEIALVKSLDNRPIIITDSGELSAWIPAARRADIFGTTMYRDTYSEFLRTYIHYPLGPEFFKFKRNFAKLFAKPQKWVVIELQAEPWGPIPFQNMSEEERNKTMNLKKFKEIIEYSRQTGFDEFYFWGVEWWYWEKEVNNNPALWEEAKKLF